jgi:hypothetical protein
MLITESSSKQTVRSILTIKAQFDHLAIALLLGKISTVSINSKMGKITIIHNHKTIAVCTKQSRAERAFAPRMVFMQSSSPMTNCSCVLPSHIMPSMMMPL